MGLQDEERSGSEDLEAFKADALAALPPFQPQPPKELRSRANSLPAVLPALVHGVGGHLGAPADAPPAGAGACMA